MRRMVATMRWSVLLAMALAVAPGGMSLELQDTPSRDTATKRTMSIGDLDEMDA